MTVSVCMGIFNGEKYIEEQLQSILEQTRRPDNVVLCDDCSTDGTVEVVSAFIERNNLHDGWVLYRNKENLGYPANFYHAMELCTGDIIFLADQDDIWHKSKIERMCGVFEHNPDSKAVCCKFSLIDADGHDISTVMAPTRSRETENIRLVTIDDVFYKCEWPGMVTAFRKEWYRSWSSGRYRIPHDFLVCARAAEEKGFLQIDECLAYHRRHNNNAGGEEHRISRLLNKERKLKEIRKYLEILHQFTIEHVMQTEEGKKALQRKLDSMQGRYGALCSGRLVKVVKNAWKNRGETRLATVVCDVVIVKH